MRKGFATTSLHSCGFTLIELLIVIAILGVLAAGVLIAINPGEQLARGRDSSRKTAVGQLSRAVQAYYTAQGATYPPASGSWITTLTTAGELKSEPAEIPGGTACVTNQQKGYCYHDDGVDVLVYVRLESKSEKAKTKTGDGSVCPEYGVAYFAWSSASGKSGLLCVWQEPSVWAVALVESWLQ